MPGCEVAPEGVGVPAMGEGCTGPRGDGVGGGSGSGGTVGGRGDEAGGGGLPATGLTPVPGAGFGAKGECGGMAVLLAAKVGLPEKTVAFAVPG